MQVGVTGAKIIHRDTKAMNAKSIQCLQLLATFQGKLFSYLNHHLLSLNAKAGQQCFYLPDVVHIGKLTRRQVYTEL